jgi:ketosteroid isomerase-like protein
MSEGVDPSAVDVVRRFYEAVADRDLDAAAACFDEHGVWILPGRSQIAGEHRGLDAIRDNVLRKVGPLSGETFRAELTDVALGDRHVVAVQHATAERDGRRLDVTGCQLIRVEHDKIVEMRGHYSDQYALDAFWS